MKKGEKKEKKEKKREKEDKKAKRTKLRFYNTASRKKETFKPIKKGQVTLYMCGPTVYDYAHIGHFFAYVFTDVLRRVLKMNGYKLKDQMNITDVGHLTSDADTGEDKMEKAAAEKKMDAWQLADYYTKDFFDAMHKLNIQDASIITKATDHVPHMIKLIERMEKNGFTYRTSDGVYYDTSKFKNYAKFARLNLEQLKEGARVESNPEKRNPSDFALWKFSPVDQRRQMEWDSPWGKGFPGWHIECTAMSMEHLGERYDIHTGGIDHINIHHTNEIAQAYGVTMDEEFVNYWMHNNHLMVDGEKMSKSKQNFYNMADIEAKGYDPLALRYLFLTAHYRTRLNFTWESLDSAEKALNTLREHVTEWKKSKSHHAKDRSTVESYQREFEAAVNDDLNTPIAVAALWKLVRDKGLSGKDKLDLMLEWDKVLGLKLDEWEPMEKDLSKEVQALVDKRQSFREEGKYQEADEIRDRLDKEFGVTLEDTADGVKWKFKKK